VIPSPARSLYTSVMIDHILYELGLLCESKGRWVTMRGTHVFLPQGQDAPVKGPESLKQAVKGGAPQRKAAKTTVAKGKSAVRKASSAMHKSVAGKKEAEYLSNSRDGRAYKAGVAKAKGRDLSDQKAMVHGVAGVVGAPKAKDTQKSFISRAKAKLKSAFHNKKVRRAAIGIAIGIALVAGGLAVAYAAGLIGAKASVAAGAAKTTAQWFKELDEMNQLFRVSAENLQQMNAGLGKTF